MARRILEQRFDDIDGTPLPMAAPVRFALSGRSYEIDLSERNLEQLRAALEPFVAAARPVRARQGS
jgi:hypothetical protein